MAIGLSGTLKQAAQAGLNVPSASKTNVFTVRITGSSGVYPSGVALVVGAHASRPVTFGDMSHTTVLGPTDLDQGSFSVNGGLLTITMSMNPGDNQALSLVEGDHAWMAFIDSTGSPISGTTLDAVVDLGVVAA